MGAGFAQKCNASDVQPVVDSGSHEKKLIFGCQNSCNESTLTYDDEDLDVAQSILVKDNIKRIRNKGFKGFQLKGKKWDKNLIKSGFKKGEKNYGFSAGKGFGLIRIKGKKKASLFGLNAKKDKKLGKKIKFGNFSALGFNKKFGKIKKFGHNKGFNFGKVTNFHSSIGDKSIYGNLF